ncbi:MAG: hypothetical protein KVP17_004857 [Porospora cf. gigantea B]|uniref:uncharacterized protein n=1 Tax=Porospora cf. gigantea B TaxID=2853592 RepID=UPI0035718AC7|nr:MAG: hypothetical protein KVP17_004857 [Porospora cf. gigantea B]
MWLTAALVITSAATHEDVWPQPIAISPFPPPELPANDDTFSGRAEAAFLKGLYDEAYINLHECVDQLNAGSTDDRDCYALLGDMLYLGLTPDYKRDWVGAVTSWSLGSDMGSPDAQFNLAVFADTYPRTMTLFEMPEDDDDGNFKILQGAQQAGLTPAEVEEAVTGESAWQAHVYDYAASVARHPGALLALSERYQRGIGTSWVPRDLERQTEGSGMCQTAYKYLLEVAKPSQTEHEAGVPMGLEIVVLTLPWAAEVSPTRRSAMALTLLVEESMSDPQLALQVALKTLLGVDGHLQNYTAARELLEEILYRANIWSTRVDTSQEADLIGRALSLLGYIFCLGLGVDQDVQTALFYFDQAASEWNDPAGWNGLGYLSFHGLAMPRDIPSAIGHFEKAANANHPDGLFNLAAVHLNGLAPNSSHAKAIELLTEAANHSHTAASFVLGVINYNGVLIEPNCHLAVRYLRAVAERHTWVATRIQHAHRFLDSARGRLLSGRKAVEFNVGALYLWRLAHAGLDSARLNLATLLEAGQTDLFFTKGSQAANRKYAQPLLELMRSKTPDTHLLLGIIAFHGHGRTPETRILSGADVLGDDFTDSDGNSLAHLVSFHKTSLEDRASEIASNSEALPPSIRHAPRHRQISYGHLLTSQTSLGQVGAKKAVVVPYYSTQKARAFYYIARIQLDTRHPRDAIATLKQMAQVLPRASLFAHAMMAMIRLEGWQGGARLATPRVLQRLEVVLVLVACSAALKVVRVAVQVYKKKED